MSLTALSHTTTLQTGFRVHTVSDLQGFLDLKTEWDALLPETGIDYPFLTHDWVRLWLECFGSDRSPYIVVVRDGPRAVGIAPLVQYTERIYGLKLRRLELPWNPHVPRSDFIVQASSEDVYRAIWEHINACSSDWDLLLLQQIAANSHTLKLLQDLPADSGYLVGLWTSDSSPYLDLTGSWEDYAETLPRKFRSNLRNRTNRLQRLGTVEYECLQGNAPDVRASLEEGYVIEAAAWKGEAGTALLSDERVKTFYTEIAAASALSKNTRINFLRLNGRRIAFDYCLSYAGIMYRLKSGYLPEYSAYSPSSILGAQTIEECFKAGLRKYDFLGKDEEWKRIWCKEVLPYYWIFVFPNRSKTALLHRLKFKWLPVVRGLRAPEPESNAGENPTEGTL